MERRANNYHDPALRRNLRSSIVFEAFQSNDSRRRAFLGLKRIKPRVPRSGLRIISSV